jgi:hypothetical protein
LFFLRALALGCVWASRGASRLTDLCKRRHCLKKMSHILGMATLS